jgi:hypothetical protein
MLQLAAVRSSGKSSTKWKSQATLESRYRGDRERTDVAAFVHHSYWRLAIAATSILAPRGKPATCTVVRAGGLLGK